jgi:arsenate reductase (thioredoxin)
VSGTSARSKVAEGLLRHEAGMVRSEAIAAMSEIGIDISGHRSKSAEESAG